MVIKPKQGFLLALLTAIVLLVGYGITWLCWWGSMTDAKKEIEGKHLAASESRLSAAMDIAKPFNWLDFRYLYGRYLLAGVYSLDNKQDAALQLFAQMEPLYSGQNKPTIPSEAEMMFAYGSAYVSTYQPAKAVPLMKRALAALERNNQGESVLAANILNTLGKIHRDQKLTAEAVPYFDRALTVRRTIYGANSKEAFTTMYDTGFNFYVDRNYSKAAEMFRQASHLAAKLKTSESAEASASAQNALAACYFQLGRKRDAMEILEAFHKSDKTGYGHTSASYTLGRLGQIFERQNKFDEAERFYQQAVVINEAIGETADPDFLEAEGRYEKMLEKNGRRDEAASLRRRIRRTS